MAARSLSKLAFPSLSALQRATSYVGFSLRNRKVLVTGGLGFIGSNLVVRLVRAGARVVVVDSEVAGCGANRQNLDGVAADVELIVSDIGESANFASALSGCETIFNLAGEISHIESMRNPARDGALNATAQLRFLEACSRIAPGIRVVYASTRQIYGAPRYLPVDEGHPVQPVDFNGIHKYAATAYHQMFSEMGRIDGRVLCLTNVYGPRLALQLTCQGFLANFLRRGLLQETIEVFGDGRQLRDPLYVDDAVEAFLTAAAADGPPSRCWNVGGPHALSVADIAKSISAIAGAPAPVFRPFPPEHKGIDIGSYCSDSTRMKEELGWHSTAGFEEGVRCSLEYFRSHFPHYLSPTDAEIAATRIRAVEPRR